jgi:hypothetical protein
MQGVRRVSSDFYVGSIAGGFFVGILLVIVGVFAGTSRPDVYGPIALFIVGIVLGFYWEIVFLVLLGVVARVGEPRLKAGDSSGDLVALGHPEVRHPVGEAALE